MKTWAELNPWPYLTDNERDCAICMHCENYNKPVGYCTVRAAKIAEAIMAGKDDELLYETSAVGDFDSCINVPDDDEWFFEPKESYQEAVDHLDRELEDERNTYRALDLQLRREACYG